MSNGQYLNAIQDGLFSSSRVPVEGKSSVCAVSMKYGPFLLKLLVTVKIMYKKKFFKCAINVVKAVQVNISNAYMKLQSMN